MDLYQYLKPLVTNKAIDALKTFHAEKVYQDTSITAQDKSSNLKHMVDFTRTNATFTSNFMQDIFASLLHEGYLKLTCDAMNALKENRDNEEAFTMFQIAGMYILKYDFSNISTHYEYNELMNLRKQVIDSFIQQLNDTTLSSTKRSIIADCLLLASNDRKATQAAQTYIYTVRHEQRQQQQQNQNLLFPHRLQQQHNAPQQAPKKVKTSAKDIDTDTQNVHASNVTNIIKRKLVKLEEDTIPTRREFFDALATVDKKEDEKKEDKKDEKPAIKQGDMVFKVRIYFGVKDCKISNNDGAINSLHQKMIVDQLGKETFLGMKVRVGEAVEPTQKPMDNLDLKQDFADVSDVILRMCSVMFGKQVHSKISPSLQRISTDPVIFEPTRMTLADIFQRVFNRVLQMKDKDFFTDLMQRVYEELIDSKHVCATGYVSRILNILSGYPEIDFEVIQSYEEEIYKDLQKIVETLVSDHEELEDSMIGITEEERKLFTDCVKENHEEWYKLLHAKWVKQKKLYYDAWFKEDFYVCLKKLSGLDLTN